LPEYTSLFLILKEVPGFGIAAVKSLFDAETTTKLGQLPDRYADMMEDTKTANY
jgi:hypothetical protein